MHPSHNECECPCLPAIDDVDLQLDKEDYYKTLEYSVKILWRLMNSTMLSRELPKNLQNSKPPSQAAMRYNFSPFNFKLFVFSKKNSKFYTQ